ncbi:MAG: lipopolysaccharide biosynthesis protein, partial [Thermodesulfobacteriota bacterium]
FFLIPLYTHYLTPADYGVLEMIDLTCTIISFILGMGITNSILRFYAEYDQKSDKEEVVNSALIFALITGIVITYVLINTSYYFSRFVLINNEYSVLFKLAFFNLFLAIIHTHCKTIFRVEGKPKTFVYTSIYTTVVALVFNIYFIAILQIGVIGFYYSSIIAFLPITIVLLFNQFKKQKITFSTKKIKKMLGYGIYFIPTLLIMFIINFSDRIFLRIYADLDTVGLYALGYKMGMIIFFLFGIPFQQVWGAYAFEIEKKKNANEVFGRIMTYYMLLGVFSALSLSVLSRELITIIADKAFIDSHVIPFIAFSAVFYNAELVTKIGILINKKTHYLPVITGITAIINIFLNIILIPKYGMTGAATATLISFIFFPIASFVVSQRMYPIKYEVDRILKCVIFAIVLVLVSKLVNFDSLGETIVVKIFIIGCFPLVLWLMNYFHDTEKEEIKLFIYKLSKARETT